MVVSRNKLTSAEPRGKIMRRVIITAGVIVTLLVIAVPIGHPLQEQKSIPQGSEFLQETPASLASAGGSGSDAQAVLYMDKSMSSQIIRIQNDFSNTTLHEAQLDLSSYLISGWTLYQVDFDIDNITATPEREVAGSSDTPGSTNLRIFEHDIDLYYDQFAQGFYLQPHDGQLNNFSIRYMTVTYSPASHNYAYFEVRSDYTDGLSNLIPVYQVPYVGLTPTWANISEAISLSADTQYYAVINGSLLVESLGVYPDIRWFDEPVTGTFGTWRHNTDGDSWGSERPFEGLLNYTYTPWNTTSDSPMVFGNPQGIDLTLDGSPQSGQTWTTSSGTNITTITFNTNQSVDVFYNLTLWYKKSLTSSTIWTATTSGGSIIWNATTLASYPVLVGNQYRFLNVSVPLDWTATGLYNSTDPATNYGNFATYGTDVKCSSMTNGLWTLQFSGNNYISEMKTYDSLTDTEITRKTDINVDMDINSTVQDALARYATTGTTNLTILHEGATVYAPATTALTNGLSHYLWDISSASDNGTFMIQLFWENGTEAGYASKEIIVYYPTALTPESVSIYADTDSNFEVRVQFDDLFNTVGIDSPDAVLTYSYRTIINASMNNIGAGTWNAIVDTTGEASGTSTLTVYAEGPAILNQSEVIIVTLTHQTSLQLEWVSDSFDWTESSIFRVNYTHDRDGSLIADATQLDITINGTTYQLHGTSGTYWIEFNNTFDLGYHTILVNISKPGYNPATDTASFTITEALTTLTVDWEPSNATIQFTQTLNLTVDYTYSGGDVPASAEVNVTINGHSYALNYGGTDWSVSISGWDLGVGVYNADIVAWLYGYEAKFNTTFNVNITVAGDQLILTPAWSSETTDYANAKILQVHVAYPNGTDVFDATVVGIINSIPYSGVHVGSGYYNISLGPFISLGDNSVNVTVSRAGFDSISLYLSLTVVETTTDLTVTPDATVIYYDNVIIVDIYYRMSNGTNLAGWTCDFYVDGASQTVVWALDHYRVTLQGFSPDLGVGVHFCNASAEWYGYESQFYLFDVTVNAIPTGVSVTGTLSMYVNQTITLDVQFTDARTDTPIVADYFDIDWPIGYDAWVQMTPGNYELTISSTALHIGIIPLGLNLTRLGYADNVTSWDIDIMAVPTTIVVGSLFTQYQNETAIFIARLRDDVHTNWVHWADIILTLDNDDYSMTYNPESGYYEVSIFLNESFAPGDFTVSLSSTAIDCEDAVGSTVLRLYEKRTYVIVVSVPAAVQWGANLGVDVNVTEDGVPVAGIRVTVYARFNMTTGEYETLTGTAVTLEDGIAQVNFDVPTDSSQVEVWAEFEGSLTEWPSTSTIVLAESSAAPSLADVLVEWISRPEVVTILLIFALVAGVTAVYRGEWRPRKHAAQRALEKQLGAFRDLQSMQHFMAVYADRGTCVFYHPFAEARIQPDLISGFIAAITSVYGEIKGTGVQGSLEEINYQGLRLNSYSGKYIIGIVIVEGEMSPRMRERLQFFVELFEDQYETDLDGWAGYTDCFDPEWVVSNLNSAFNYHWMLPHTISKVAKPRGISAKITKFLQRTLTNGEFRFADVIGKIADHMGCVEAEAFDNLLRMAEAGIIKPIGIHTVLQRQGLGLAEEDEAGAIYVEPTRVEDEPEVIEEVPEPEVEDVPDESEVIDEAPEVEEVIEEPELIPEELVTDEVAEPEIEVEVEKEEEPPEMKVIRIMDEEEEPVDETAKFLEDVESLLESEEKEEKKPEKSEEEKFLEDVEKLLSEKKNEDE
ncbi:MAG: hypothetical protein ACFE7R_02215 [Candidatus Hodarchaeota archaeon]